METNDEAEAVDLTAEDIEFLYGTPPPDRHVPTGEEIEGSQRPEQAPVDFRHAAWFAAKAHAADKRAQEQGAEFDRLINHLKVERDKVVGPLLRRMEWFDRGVEMWHRSALADRGEEVGKSVTFPCGRESKLRKARPVVAVSDHDTLLAFSQAQKWNKVYKPVAPDDRFRVSELQKVATLVPGSEAGANGKYVTGDGEVVPGITVIEQHDSWSNGQQKGRK